MVSNREIKGSRIESPGSKNLMFQNQMPYHTLKINPQCLSSGFFNGCFLVIFFFKKPHFCWLFGVLRVTPWVLQATHYFYNSFQVNRHKFFQDFFSNKPTRHFIALKTKDIEKNQNIGTRSVTLLWLVVSTI